ncbi:hypothetical protein DWU95_10250, partial [Burkholderia contaminans]
VGGVGAGRRVRPGGVGCAGGARGAEGRRRGMGGERGAGGHGAGFGVGSMQRAMGAEGGLLGGDGRGGLEDNIWLGRGGHATNGTLVERAREIIERLGARVLTPAEGRRKLGLPARGERPLERRAIAEFA